MEHYMRRKHHLNMSMESYISMAATRWKQTQDDSPANCTTDMRNVRNGMNAVKQHYSNNKDMKLLFHDMTAYVDDVPITNNQLVIDIMDYLMEHDFISSDEAWTSLNAAVMDMMNTMRLNA